MMSVVMSGAAPIERRECIRVWDVVWCADASGHRRDTSGHGFVGQPLIRGSADHQAVLSVSM